MNTLIDDITEFSFRYWNEKFKEDVLWQSDLEDDRGCKLFVMRHTFMRWCYFAAVN